MQLVGAGFGGDVDDSTAGLAELSGVGGSLDAEFLDSFWSEADHGAAVADAGIVDSVGEEGGTAGPSTVDAQVVAGHGGARGEPRIFCAGIAHHVGLREREIEHASIDQRCVADLTLVDGGAGGARLGIDGRAFGGDCDRRCDCAWLQSDVDGGGGCGVDLHCLDDGLLEALRFDGHGVGDGTERGRRVGA